MRIESNTSNLVTHISEGIMDQNCLYTLAGFLHNYFPHPPVRCQAGGFVLVCLFTFSM